MPSAPRAWPPRWPWWASTPPSPRRTSAAHRRGGSRCGAERRSASRLVLADDVLDLVGRSADRVLDLARRLVDVALALQRVVARDLAARLLEAALRVIACAIAHEGSFLREPLGPTRQNSTVSVSPAVRPPAPPPTLARSVAGPLFAPAVRCAASIAGLILARRSVT